MTLKNTNNTIETRPRAIRAIRDWFYEQGFTEVDTPTMSTYGEQNEHLEQFTATSTAGEQYYLNSSPELDMKKLLSYGHQNIFQICKSYRANEPDSKQHQPEFTMLEWYRANAEWATIVDDLQNLCRDVAQKTGITNAQQLVQQPWRQRSMTELFREYAGINLDDAIDDDAVLAEYCKAKYDTGIIEFEEGFNLIFLNEIEPHLGKEQPDVVTHFPAPLAALAELDPNNPRYALRFELYINGIELANAFQELTDATEQRARFDDVQAYRKQHNKEVLPIDTAFLEALEYGIPRSAGIAFGVDRFIMLLAGANDIRDVIWFPTQHHGNTTHKRS